MIRTQDLRLFVGATVLGVINRGFTEVLKLKGLPRPTDSSGPRVMVLKLDRLGDAILASPFFRELRRNYPSAHITAFVSKCNAEVFDSCPYIDKLVPIPGVGLALKKNAVLAAHRIMVDRPTIAFVPRVDMDIYGAVEAAFLSGAARRIGFSENSESIKALLNWGADTLLSDIVHAGGVTHEVERNLSMLTALGHPVTDKRIEFWPSHSVSGQIPVPELRKRVGDGPLIAAGIFASEDKKTWPLKRFKTLCQELRREIGARFVLLGSPTEVTAVEQARVMIGDGVAIAGSYPLTVTGRILEQCDLFVGCDSGQKHIAAAMGVPVVEVNCHPADGDPRHRYSPRRFGAWGVPTSVVQPCTGRKPCVRGCGSRVAHCILDVSVEDVKASLLAALGTVTTVREGHGSPKGRLHRESIHS